MKKISFLISFFLFSLISFSQSRLDSWKSESIESFTIEIKIDDNIELCWFSNKEDVDTIFNFLKEIELKPIDETINKKEILNDWKFRINQKKYSDLILICDGYIFIGKSMFKIDEEIIKNFNKLISKIN